MKLPWEYNEKLIMPSLKKPDPTNDMAELPELSSPAAPGNPTELTIPVISGNKPFALRIDDKVWVFEPKGIISASINQHFTAHHIDHHEVDIQLNCYVKHVVIHHV